MTELGRPTLPEVIIATALSRMDTLCFEVGQGFVLNAFAAILVQDNDVIAAVAPEKPANISTLTALTELHFAHHLVFIKLL